MTKEAFQANTILRLSFEFSIEIVKYTEELNKLRKFAIAQQLIRSGTSIGANLIEAQSPQSRADFIHKVKIAHKEAEETEYWLLICDEINEFPSCKELLEKVRVLIKIINKIIHSSVQNRN